MVYSGSQRRRNMVKGMNIEGYHEDRAESQAALERIAKPEFQGVSSYGRYTDWVICLNQKK